MSDSADPANLSDLEGYFDNIISSIVALGGLVLFVMLLIGGFKYITSGDDPKKAESARNTLTYSIAGLVLIALSYLVLVIINQLTGAQILNFVVTQ